MGEVCGLGTQCERTCPVKLIGRICPDLPTFLEELRILSVEGEAFPQLDPQPA
jgi:hypothetical protein